MEPKNKQENCEIKAKQEKVAMEWYVKNKLNNGQIILTTESSSISSSFDFWINSGSTEYIAEVKVRKDITGAQADKWGGPYFEHLKFAGICSYKEKYNHSNEVLYFNFFKDELRIYKIRKDPTYYSWYQKKLPKNNYDKQLVWKYVVDLTKEDLIETIKYDKKRDI